MKQIYQMLASPWALEPAVFASLRHVLFSAIESGNIAQVSQFLSIGKEEPKVWRLSSPQPPVAASLSPSGRDCFAVPGHTMAGLPAAGALDEPQVLVVEVTGTIYSYVTFRCTAAIGAALKDPAVAGIVLWINSPGGESTGVQALAQMLAQAQKPVCAFVAGMAQSAAYWIATATKRIFCASSLCEVGCVGVMSTFADYGEFFQRQGIDIKDIYADSSDLKNEEFRAMQQGDDKPLRAALNHICEVFCRDVAQGLGLDYDPQLPIFRGRTYFADQALEQGYAHAIGTLDDAAKWVFDMHLANEITNH